MKAQGRQEAAFFVFIAIPAVATSTFRWFTIDFPEAGPIITRLCVNICGYRGSFQGRRLRVVKKGRLLKYETFFICWLFSIYIVLTLSASNRIKTFCSQSVENCNFELELPKNQLGAFSYVCFDSKANYRPIYAIAFENLLLENNNFGPFKTAIHKRAMIRDLKLRFYHCTSGLPNVSLASAVSVPDAEELIKETADILTRPSNRYGIGNINFASVSEVYADRFDCRFFYENTLLLSVHCRKATASYRNSNVELRGHVTIRTQDGTTLESNYVEWDVRNNTFNVKSLYALNHNGAVKTGGNACFDFALNEVLSHQARNCTKEEHECVAKL
jgi:hypothetical protein